MARPKIGITNTKPNKPSVTINTELGKIFYKYKDDRFKCVRIVDINKENKSAILYELDEDMHIIKNTRKEYNKDQLVDLYKNWTLLKSEGACSIYVGTIASYKDKDVNDVILAFYKNGKSGEPTFLDTEVVARQCLENIYYPSFHGISFTKDSTPGIDIINLLACSKIVSTKTFHVYKTDNISDFVELGDSEEVDKTFKYWIENEKVKIYGANDILHKDDEVVKGFCKDLRTFLENIEFVSDYRRSIGIGELDFSLENQDSLNEANKLFIKTIYGNINICRSLIIPFNYTYDLSLIKMSFIIVSDVNDKFYIIGYTESPSQYTDEELKKIPTDIQLEVYNRLKKKVNVYLNAEKEDSKK